MTSDSPFILHARIETTLAEYEQLRGELTHAENQLLQLIEDYEQRFREVYLNLWREEQKKPTVSARASATVLELMAQQVLDKEHQMLASRYAVQKETVQALRNRLASFKIDTQLLHQLTVLQSVEARISGSNDS